MILTLPPNITLTKTTSDNSYAFIGYTKPKRIKFIKLYTHIGIIKTIPRITCELLDTPGELTIDYEDLPKSLQSKIQLYLLRKSLEE